MSQYRKLAACASAVSFSLAIIYGLRPEADGAFLVFLLASGAGGLWNALSDNPK